MEGFCPLDGESCTNPKKVKVIKMIDGKPVQVKVCADCAPQHFKHTHEDAKQYIWHNYLNAIFNKLHIDQILSEDEIADAIDSIKNHHDLNDFLDGLMKRQDLDEVKSVAPCPCCEMTLVEVLREGKLGCGGCYDVFTEYLTPIIMQVQENNIKHIGKHPKQFQDPDVEKLEKEMKAAAKEERYEDAAIYRDQIKSLRKLL